MDELSIRYFGIIQNKIREEQKLSDLILKVRKQNNKKVKPCKK